MSVAVDTLVTDAYREIQVFGVGQTPDADTSDWAVRKLQRLLNLWNADSQTVWALTFLEETIVPNLNPSTIGPSGATFTVAQRPVKLYGANVILNNVSPVIRTPLTLRDWQWWQLQSVQAVTTTFPTDLYYSPDWPNGSIYLWPLPTIAYGLELVVANVLSDTLTISDTLDVPPGWQEALTLTLAEGLAGAYGAAIPPKLDWDARQARAIIFGDNDRVPLFATRDSGMTAHARSRPSFNYRTGLTVPRRF